MTQNGIAWSSNVEPQVVEAGLGAVEETEPVAARLDVQIRIGRAVDHRGVAEELRHPDRVQRVRRDAGRVLAVVHRRVEEAAVGVELLVLQHHRQLVLAVAGGDLLAHDLRAGVDLVEDQVGRGQAEIRLEARGAHRVVVVPEHGCRLVVDVGERVGDVVGALLTVGGPPLHGGPVVPRRGMSAVEVRDGSARGHVRAGEGRVDGVLQREVLRLRREVVDVLDHDGPAAGGDDGRAEQDRVLPRLSVGPHGRRVRQRGVEQVLTGGLGDLVVVRPRRVRRVEGLVRDRRHRQRVDPFAHRWALGERWRGHCEQAGGQYDPDEGDRPEGASGALGHPVGRPLRVGGTSVDVHRGSCQRDSPLSLASLAGAVAPARAARSGERRGDSGRLWGSTGRVAAGSPGGWAGMDAPLQPGPPGWE